MGEHGGAVSRRVEIYAGATNTSGAGAFVDGASRQEWDRLLREQYAVERRAAMKVVT